MHKEDREKEGRSKRKKNKVLCLQGRISQVVQRVTRSASRARPNAELPTTTLYLLTTSTYNYINTYSSYMHVFHYEISTKNLCSARENLSV